MVDVVRESDLIKSNRARYWETMSFWFAVAMLLVFPIYMDKTRYYSITEAKWHAFMFLDIAYLGVCLVIAAVVFISKDERSARFRNGFQKLSLPQILIILYFALACLSTVLSDYGLDCIIGQSRYEGLLSLFLYDGIFFGMSFWGEFSRNIFYAMAVAGIIVGAIGCLQVFKKDILFDEGYSYYNTGFASTLGNVDCISGVIATLVPVMFCAFILLDEKLRFIFPVSAALMLFLQFVIDVDSGKLGLMAATLIAIPFLVDDKKKALRTAQMFGVICIVLGLRRMFTFPAVWPRAVEEIEDIQFAVTKPAGLMVLLGAVVIIVAIFLEIRLDKKLQGTKKGEKAESFRLESGKIRKYIFFAFGLMAVAAFTYVFNYAGENKLLFDLHEATHLRLSDDAGSGRGAIYKGCFKLIAENPAFGCGPGAFVSAFEPYDTYFESVTDFAHCDLLQIGVCQGLVGLAVYVAFLVSLIVPALKNAYRFPPIIIMGAGMAGYLVHSFFSFSIAIVTPTFWILAGILDKTIRQLPSNKGAKADSCIYARKGNNSSNMVNMPNKTIIKANKKRKK